MTLSNWINRMKCYSNWPSILGIHGGLLDPKDKIKDGQKIAVMPKI
jgi:hypothetical protein